MQRKVLVGGILGTFVSIVACSGGSGALQVTDRSWEGPGGTGREGPLDFRETPLLSGDPSGNGVCLTCGAVYKCSFTYKSQHMSVNVPVKCGSGATGQICTGDINGPDLEDTQSSPGQAVDGGLKASGSSSSGTGQGTGSGGGTGSGSGSGTSNGPWESSGPVTVRALGGVGFELVFTQDDGERLVVTCFPTTEPADDGKKAPNKIPTTDQPGQNPATGAGDGGAS